MPGLLDQNIDTQNVCCTKAFNYFHDKKAVSLSYRKLIRLKLSDSQYYELGFTPEKYNNLDEEVSVPLIVLDSINFKYECDVLCPFPECLEELKAWEVELIMNYATIVDIVSWLSIGMSIEKVALWFRVDPNDIRRWNNKRKKIGEKINVYKDFENLINYR